MLKTIEINDTLQDTVDQCIEGTKELLLEWLQNNPESDISEPAETPCLHNDLDYDGRFHEIIDGNTPIYTHEIDTIFYLHGHLCEEAFENCFGAEAKKDEGWPCGWKAAAIYQYLSDKACEWYQENAEDFSTSINQK
tara:strand:- start:18949 stop:19359 length:411 start_codon:yes stop_codon:yes gene_type:complete